MLNIVKTQSKINHRLLRILAVILWYIGGIILTLKGGELLFEAEALRPGQIWAWLTVGLGLFFGAIKVKYLFRKVCKKNLIRINSLDNPKLWQFYRLGFFLFLAAMIVLGATLSRMAHGNYPFLLSVAILDFSLATALLGSSPVFWEEKAFTK